MTWTPLGPDAWTIEPIAPELAESLARFPGVRDAWPCADRLAIEVETGFDREAFLAHLATLASDPSPQREIVIGARYDGPDLEAVAESLGLSPEDVIRLHAEAVYTCVAVGFCPGFGYLAGLPAELSGLPRRANPRSLVTAGSIAIAGERTAIYPLDRPGGWNLIARTDETMVDVGARLFRLRTGDRVRFRRVG